MISPADRLQRLVLLCCLIFLPVWMLGSPCLAVETAVTQNLPVASVVYGKGTTPGFRLGFHFSKEKIGVRTQFGNPGKEMVTASHRRINHGYVFNTALASAPSLIWIFDVTDVTGHLLSSTTLAAADRSPPVCCSL